MLHKQASLAANKNLSLTPRLKTPFLRLKFDPIGTDSKVKQAKPLQTYSLIYRQILYLRKAAI
ncbi:MAG: hypothetical protein M3O30_16825 [Planctomycetota bacterium]|nr:hypothetical protein [Planctomycetota bacterium]